MKIANKWKTVLQPRIIVLTFLPPQILIYKIYTLKLFKSAEVSFIKWLISFVMFCRDIWRTIEINYKEYNILQNVEKHGFFGPHRLKGPNKKRPTFWTDVYHT